MTGEHKKIPVLSYKPIQFIFILFYVPMSTYLISTKESVNL